MKTKLPVALAAMTFVALTKSFSRAIHVEHQPHRETRRERHRDPQRRVSVQQFPSAGPAPTSLTYTSEERVIREFLR